MRRGSSRASTTSSAQAHPADSSVSTRDPPATVHPAARNTIGNIISVYRCSGFSIVPNKMQRSMMYTTSTPFSGTFRRANPHTASPRYPRFTSPVPIAIALCFA